MGAVGLDEALLLVTELALRERGHEPRREFRGFGPLVACSSCGFWTFVGWDEAIPTCPKPRVNFLGGVG